MGILCRKLSLAAAIGLATYGAVQAQGSEDLPENSGMLCQEPNAFAYVKQGNGSLDFAYRLYLKDAVCAFNGNALPNGSGWVYRGNESCTFAIMVEDNAATFNTEDDSCRSVCGFNAHVYDRAIPLSASVKINVTPAFLEDAFYRYECP
jgi:hypothetical protein